MFKSQDLFGHHIHLNFNRNGQSHKTTLGGFVSVMIKGWMFFYVYYIFRKMLFYEDDKSYNDQVLIDLKDLGTVNYNQTDQFIFFSLMKQLKGWTGVYLDDKDLSSYIEIGFW